MRGEDQFRMLKEITPQNTTTKTTIARKYIKSVKMNTYNFSNKSKTKLTYKIELYIGKN